MTGPELTEERFYLPIISGAAGYARLDWLVACMRAHADFGNLHNP